MKTHDFARQLEMLAKFLRSLPNADLGETLQRELWVDGFVKGESEPARLVESRALPPDIDERLRTMSSAEIETYLKSESSQFTSAQLLAIAERLGISASKRQSKEALINGITRYFEASQMDVMIRGTRKDEG